MHHQPNPNPNPHNIGVNQIQNIENGEVLQQYMPLRQRRTFEREEEDLEPHPSQSQTIGDAAPA